MVHHIPYTRLNDDLAYVLGVIGPGDGFIFRDGVALETIDKDFAEEFKKRVEKVTGIKCKLILFTPQNLNWKRKYRVILFSRRFRDFLGSFGVSFREEKWRIPEAVMRSQDDGIKATYLRAIADSQASVNKGICIEVKNFEGLEQVQKLLENFRLRTYLVERSNRKGMCTLWITGRNSLEKFFLEIGFTIKRKRRKLEKRLQECRYERTPTREVNKLVPEMIRLRKLGFTCKQIAQNLGVNAATVWVRLKKSQIK